MPFEVLETPLAEAQAARLRGPAARAYQVFLDDLARRGSAALGYRVSGPNPLERLCVRHLRGEDRVVVAFQGETRAWVLLIGPIAPMTLAPTSSKSSAASPGFDRPRTNAAASRRVVVTGTNRRRSTNRPLAIWWFEPERSSGATAARRERGGRNERPEAGEGRLLGGADRRGTELQATSARHGRGHRFQEVRPF